MAFKSFHNTQILELNIYSCYLQSGRDILHILCLTRALGGETHQFATSVDDALGLGHAAFCVVGIDGGHRLYADRVVASYPDVTNMGYSSFSSLVHINSS